MAYMNDNYKNKKKHGSGKIRGKPFPGPGWKCRLCGKCSKQSETKNLDYLKTTHEEFERKGAGMGNYWRRFLTSCIPYEREE